MAPVERRIDPDDGTAYTWEEFSDYYRGKYKKKAIEAYWEECKVAGKKKGKKKDRIGIRTYLDSVSNERHPSCPVLPPNLRAKT